MGASPHAIGSAHAHSLGIVSFQRAYRGPSTASVGAPKRSTLESMSTHRASVTKEQHLELPVEELLSRARPLPSHDEMVIEDLTAEEGEAFVLAVET